GGSATAAQDVSEGVNLISVNFVAGSTGISLQDSSGNEILSGAGADINASPSTYDFNFLCYVLPANATPSTYLSGTSTSSNSSTASTSSALISQATTGSAGSTGSGTSKGQTETSADVSGSHSTFPASPASSGSGSTGTSGSSATPGSSSSTGGDSSTGSSTLPSTGWLGLKTWEWFCIIGLVLVLLAGVFVHLAKMHGAAAPSEKDDSTSTDGSSTDDDGTSTSTDSDGSDTA
ncbi:hypothetical protein JCM5296_004040, partial [Sporobolomyces johnsonii]